MAWIVEQLLANRTIIKESSNLYEKEYRGMNPYKDVASLDASNIEMSYLDPKLENDEYNDLILIESAIEKLAEKGVLNDDDLKILKFVEDGNIFFSGETGLGRGKAPLSRRFTELCERIGFYMGGYFTDDGFIEHMAIKYDLSNEDVNKIRDLFQSKYRNLRRK